MKELEDEDDDEEEDRDVPVVCSSLSSVAVFGKTAGLQVELFGVILCS